MWQHSVFPGGFFFLQKLSADWTLQDRWTQPWPMTGQTALSTANHHFGIPRLPANLWDHESKGHFQLRGPINRHEMPQALNFSRLRPKKKWAKSTSAKLPSKIQDNWRDALVCQDRQDTKREAVRTLSALTGTSIISSTCVYAHRKKNWTAGKGDWQHYGRTLDALCIIDDVQRIIASSMMRCIISQTNWPAVF